MDGTATDRVEQSGEAEGSTVHRGCPVHDYNPYEKLPILGHAAEMDKLREEYPIFKTTYGSGFYNVTRFDDVNVALRNPTAFSAASKPYEPNPVFKFIPLMLDPPMHTKWRQFLAPYFSPGAANAMAPRIREHCRSLVERLAASGRCEFLEDFALQYPTVIFLELIGLPVSELDTFLDWVAEVIHRVMFLPPSEENSKRKVASIHRIMEYFSSVLDDRQENPQDDVLTDCLTWTIDGQPVPREDLLSMFVLLFLAGLDTVASQLSYVFHHLATHTEERERIVADPSVISLATEEYLRLFTFVNLGRQVVAPVDLAGQQLKPGDLVYLWSTAASRDPRRFNSPQDVDFARPSNAHLAFGAGAHRCLGAHLARVELDVALEEWHKIIPNYRLDESIEAIEFGSMPTPKLLGLRWDAATG